MQRALAALLLYNFTTNGLEPRVPLRLKNPNFAEHLSISKGPSLPPGEVLRFPLPLQSVSANNYAGMLDTRPPQCVLRRCLHECVLVCTRRSGAYPCYLSVHPVRCASDLEFSVDRGRVCITLLLAIAAPTQAAAHASPQFCSFVSLWSV